MLMANRYASGRSINDTYKIVYTMQHGQYPPQREAGPPSILDQADYNYLQIVREEAIISIGKSHSAISSRHILLWL
jgi:hypothetical protein